MNQFFKKGIVWLLRLEASLVVKKYKPHIIAVTGSVGKTSTKDAIYAVVSAHAHVRKSEKSFNSEIGIPLTILGCPNAWRNPLQWAQNLLDGLFLIIFRAPYPEWLVLEVGADRPGDIRGLARWLRADIVVITHLPEVPVHVEFFDSPEEVMEEKASLINALVSGGTLVLFGDDQGVASLATRAPHARILTFGFAPGRDARADNFSFLYESETENKKPIGMQAELSMHGRSAPLSIIGSLGRHMFLPALAAAAVGEALGEPIETIIAALGAYQPPVGRMHLISGARGALIIDDTYNSSPAAVAAALDTLGMIHPKGRRIAVLGDMLELGRHSVEEHRKAGAHAAKNCDLLVTVGFRARDSGEGALDAGLADTNIFQYEDAERAADELSRMVGEGDCILVKGSQSMRMERIVKTLMADPSQAPQLLVRQDEEWNKR
jgi:UDP-N-acetylmuramyl pentapeptide synthase